jgi:hypothetical protein
MTLVARVEIWSISNADSGYRALNSCILIDGKTIDDVRIVNSKWVEFINENVEGRDITSYIITSVVGDMTPGKFQFVDSFYNFGILGHIFKSNRIYRRRYSIRC